MSDMDAVIEEYKKDHGFSDEAWALYQEKVGEAMDLDNEVSVLRDIARRSAILVRWFSREDWPHVEFSDAERSGMDGDARGLAEALERASYYKEGWGA